MDKIINQSDEMDRVHDMALTILRKEGEMNFAWNWHGSWLKKYFDILAQLYNKLIESSRFQQKKVCQWLLGFLEETREDFQNQTEKFWNTAILERH